MRTGPPCSTGSGFPWTVCTSSTSSFSASSSGRLVVYPSYACVMRWVASGFGLASAMTVASCTPSHSTSIFDQVVTQWKSLVSSTWGRASKSFQERRTGSSTAPSTTSSHFERGTFGWRPRSSTGQPVVTVCPSGTFGIPWRLGGPCPSGRESDAAGVCFIRFRNRSRSLRRASTTRLSFSSMWGLYARTSGRDATSTEGVLVPRMHPVPGLFWLGCPSAPVPVPFDHPMRLRILSPDDKFHDACGVFGVFGHPEASNLAYLGIHALQHRGQESAGIASWDGVRIYLHKAMGLVADIFDQHALAALPGSSAIGHTRYSTAGQSNLANAQPMVARTTAGQVAVAHNGNLVNAEELRADLAAKGALFHGTSDTEVIVHLLAHQREGSIEDRIHRALANVRGAYSLLFLTEKGIVAVRDPLGFRPLVLGKLKTGALVFASETCALDLIEAEYVREIEPGEMVMVDSNGLRTIQTLPRQRSGNCIFELVYFARPDSQVFGRSVYATRKELGRRLAIEAPVEADVVIPVPDSGVPAALGYAEQSGIPYDLGLIRSHYVGRTFIEPSQSIRHFGVKLKLNPVPHVVKGKRVVVVDDSIVRGTTSRKIVKMLRDAGAREVHLRISAPPTRWPCYYGIDTPVRSELIAASHTVDEIARYVTADSLGYLSQEGMHEAVRAEPRSFCDACFTGEYLVQLTPAESQASKVS